ncbi:MAG TPA: ABC transporter permease subunit [Gaiellaceae bacterium]|nr:ABC transporter permease subunit [Gaiellaceae bacterium]
MSTFDVAAATPIAVEKPVRRRPKLAETWWRHVVGIVGCLVALFPIWFVASASFDASQSISGTSYLPTQFTLHNYGHLLHDNVRDPSSGSIIDAPFLRWLANTLLVAIVVAICTVLLSALAAYAFSRFRFRGRRFGMLSLLLIQMFPSLLLIVALYLIILNVGSIFPVIGLNTYPAIILVYLGGALGVNTWLMKGFLDSIPKELDESARVDGATPAQIFWGVVLPLALPILAVIGLWSFIATLNEFAIASAILQTSKHFTLAFGMQRFIQNNYGQLWGPFSAACLIAAVPAALLFAWLQRYIVSGLAQGAVKG